VITIKAFALEGAITMNKLGLLEGVGALLLNGAAIAKAEYEISVNQYEDGFPLAFGWMRVSKHVIPLIDESDGSYTLRLKNSEQVELALDKVCEDIINFDLTDEKSLSRCWAVIFSEWV
jgi:hypothetical protein